MTKESLLLVTRSQWLKHVFHDLKIGYSSEPHHNYLISFPKCGATWLQFMLVQILTRHFQLESTSFSVELDEFTARNPTLPRIVWHHDGSAILFENGTQPDPHIIFNYGGRLRYIKSRVLLMIRDPRDVVVSHYYQVTRRSDHPLVFNGLSEFVRHPTYGFERIIRFYQIWYLNRWVPRVFQIIRYEDLVLNGVTTLRETVQFLGLVEIEDGLLSSVYEFSEAGNMRELEIRGAIEGMRSFGTSADALKVRRAKIGGYKDELSPSDIEYCNQRMAHLPQAFHYA